ncbi:hypothetical protein MNBD_DELTA01-709 [hydrothermal vent metagenome]|uniref:M23ase beta-sheet core domain-containing protein n=1 Tax=hydrothermal vent metagenome TaxID=652676 RepID=A0A3B0R878_9ZZZZ
MEGQIELQFDVPVGDRITPDGGEFGAPRWYGGHKGVDFRSNWGTEVRASERGKVVFSSMIEGSKEKTMYGNVVVIDHTFEVECGGRHLYTLYAHMHTRRARRRRIVEKDEVIGTTGNSGTRESYSGAKPKDQKGYHLHFELIDSPRKLRWRGGNWSAKSLRKNPFKGYI